MGENSDAHHPDAVTSDHFSMELYERTLLKAKSLGYAFPTVSELAGGFDHLDRFLLMRHDIDVSPMHALEMARLEHRLGVRSSYYVLMHSRFYNPGAPEHWDALREIADRGFEVGLHYEVDFFEDRGLDPIEGICGDARALGELLSVPVKSVSQHRPANGTVITRINDYFVDAYRKDLVCDLLYISDSGFKWRGETLEDCLGRVEKIHALVHPLTWRFADLDMAETYYEVGRQICARTQQEVRRFIDSTQAYLKTRSVMDAERRRKYEVSTGAEP